MWAFHRHAATKKQGSREDESEMFMKAETYFHACQDDILMSPISWGTAGSFKRNLRGFVFYGTLQVDDEVLEMLQNNERAVRMSGNATVSGTYSEYALMGEKNVADAELKGHPGCPKQLVRGYKPASKSYSSQTALSLYMWWANVGAGNGRRLRAYDDVVVKTQVQDKSPTTEVPSVRQECGGPTGDQRHIRGSKRRGIPTFHGTIGEIPGGSVVVNEKFHGEENCLQTERVLEGMMTVASRS
ncbi:hypothetical protein DFS33DRAFT_1270765 [Desarmillaria ectypa]|nr:hypothetical protein DFS33DRAFT_1270765 [Desarmillaria ectypa]